MILDTSIVIDHLRGNIAVTARLEAADRIFVPLQVLGELLYGARRSRSPDRGLVQIEEFMGAVQLISPGNETAYHYARIKAALADSGTPIPENDIWIAALAMETGGPLWTRDRHFNAVAGLALAEP